MSDERFLSRWSRLKRKAVETKTAEAAVQEDDPHLVPAETEAASLPRPAGEGRGGGQGEDQDDTPESTTPEDPLKDLPPVEELTAESDFTPFLRAEVPEDLHRQALRKLWTSDPVFANDDGLKDYADDYASLFNGSVPVKTLYRVGKGFLDAIEEAEERAVLNQEGQGQEGQAIPDGKEIPLENDMTKTA